MKPRAALLRESLRQRILVLDGAMGTALQDLRLSAEDFGGPEYEGCNEHLVLTRPELIRGIHEKYLEAGCDIVETNTFGATPLVLDEYGLGAGAHEINRRAAELAREACARFDSPAQPRFVAGSVGPTTKAISVTGGVAFEELIGHFLVQLRGLRDGGCDYFLLETCQDTRNIKAALLAYDRLNLESPGVEPLPIAVSGTIEPMGTMLAGQSIEALYASLDGRDLLYLGLNCATGPEFMTDPVRSLARISRFPVSCVPNAGLPDENGHYLESPEMVARVIERFIEGGWINVIGGCCGTHAGHVRELVRAARGRPPRRIPEERRSLLSGIDFLELSDELRPVLVGERTNVIGSKKFKELIASEKFEEASEIARAQVRGGAHVIDVCLANPDRDEFGDMERFLEKVVRKVRAPLMIDSTDERVIEMALSHCQGKAIINSINLEDGEERFEKVVPLARRYGAALVVGTIDDDPVQGMAVSRARKLAVAERSYRLLTEKYGVAPEDIYWDPLVFPCASGDAQYQGSAAETIEGLRLIKERFPATRSVLGISNVSFGLPAAGREVLNSVFLYHCVKAGLDLAIVNSEKLVRFAGIPADEVKLAEDLLFDRRELPDADPIAAFAAKFRDRKAAGPARGSRASLPLEQRLARAIVEATKEGLVDDLNEAMKSARPLEIINGPLMAGMDEVGRLFNANQLIVAEVLQSAEVMKAAVAHLEPFMERTESSLRGKVLLATVKGDVHDIGKNLVEIILSNNGFEVVNLGIKVPPEQLLTAIRSHKPDLVGLSGLLVKSAQQMVVTAEDLSRAGATPPMLVGGAALSENFVDRQIARAYAGTVEYAKDAMAGLDLAKRIVDPAAFEALRHDVRRRRDEKAARAGNAAAAAAPRAAAAPTRRSRAIEELPLESLPPPPDFERHVLKGISIEEPWRFINPLMLYGRHLGVPGGLARKLDRLHATTVSGNSAAIRKLREEIEARDPRALQLLDAVEALKASTRGTPLMQPAAVFRYFRAQSDGNALRLFEDGARVPVAEFIFPRQRREDGLCLSDYTTSIEQCGMPIDSVALFVTTVGRGVREEAERLKREGRYLDSHVLQALAIESAEGYAEWLHAKLRAGWGFPDAPATTMMERFQAKYRGKRYSFGYPACPRLEDQVPLFRALRPSDIGVELTEGFMMDPEASVSAIVFHHPRASYFSVGTTGDGLENEART